MKTLAEYVAEKLKEKRLTRGQVAKRSNGEINRSYIDDIVNGTATNPTVGKLQALARALGVDEDELFDVARGIELGDTGLHGGEPWPPNQIIELIQKVTSSSDLTVIAKRLLAMKPAKLKAVRAQIEKE